MSVCFAVQHTLQMYKPPFFFVILKPLSNIAMPVIPSELFSSYNVPINAEY